MKKPAAAVASWCTFRLDGRLYGVAVERVQEVLGSAEIAPLPLSPPAVRGLVNLRGQIVTALDLRTCLGIPGSAPERAAHVVIADASAPISLLVDSIGDVARTAPGVLYPAPETLNARGRDLLQGAAPLSGDLLWILDLDRVLEAAFAT